MISLKLLSGRAGTAVMGERACSLPTKFFTAGDTEERREVCPVFPCVPRVKDFDLIHRQFWVGRGTVSARHARFFMTFYDPVFSSVPGKVGGQERVEFLHLAKI